LDNSVNCGEEIEKMVFDVINVAVSYANVEDDPVSAITSTVSVVKAFDFPICNQQASFDDFVGTFFDNLKK